MKLLDLNIPIFGEEQRLPALGEAELPLVHERGGQGGELDDALALALAATGGQDASI